MKLTYSLESVFHTNFNEDITCIGLEFQKFLKDLQFTADSEYKGYADYPEEVFHDILADCMKQLGEDGLELPLMFSVELDEEMSMLEFPFRCMLMCASFLKTASFLR